MLRDVQPAIYVSLLFNSVVSCRNNILCETQYYSNPLSSKEILPAIFYDDGKWELLRKDISSQVFHDQFSCKLVYSTWFKNNVLVILMNGIARESFQIMGDY